MKTNQNNTNIKIKAVIPVLVEDYLNFFENSAFSDNPHWSSCYCYFPHAPHDTCNWKDRSAKENRSAVIDSIMNSKMHGYIAYDGEKPIGWCNACPRIKITIAPEYEELEASKIGSIVCFIIAKEYRRKGISRLLLKTACNGFMEQGFKYAEGYPLKGVEGEASNHHGPLDLYLSEGFEAFASEDNTIIVRKNLKQI